MTKRKRRALIWTASLFAVLAIITVAVTIFISTLGQDKAKQYVSAAVSKATGRELNIDGDIRLDFGWISRIRASDIRFQNAPWSKHPQMAEVDLLDVQIDLRELLTKFRVVLPAITISQPRVILEKNADGSANWEFSSAPAATGVVVPQERSGFPVIENSS